MVSLLEPGTWNSWRSSLRLTYCFYKHGTADGVRYDSHLASINMELLTEFPPQRGCSISSAPPRLLRACAQIRSRGRTHTLCPTL